MKEMTEILIIGGGPGGYVAALKAAQFNKKVILVEKDKLGGTCLNYGCIPTKVLLHNSWLLEEIKNSNFWGIDLEIKEINLQRIQQRKKQIVNQLVKGVEFLLRKNHVKVITGTAKFENDHIINVVSQEEEFLIEAENIILATGSLPSELPFLKIDEEKIISSKEALELIELPKKFIVIGAGAVGLELGLIYHRFGSEVAIIEIMPTILPGNDQEIALNLERILKRKGLSIYTNTKVEEVKTEGNLIKLKAINLETNKILDLEAEKILLAVGRKPNHKNLGLEKLGIEKDKSGFIKVDSYLRTNIPNVYAIGDLIGGKLLAHKASHEGIIAVSNICKLPSEMDYTALPSAVFTEPEFSTVGLTEQEALKKGIKIKVGRFPFRANGRAITIGQGEGIVKIVANEKGEIIGAHLLGPQASELISELTLAIHLKRKVKEIGETIHIHPTLSESIWEANLNVLKESIHILN